MTKSFLITITALLYFFLQSASIIHAADHIVEEGPGGHVECSICELSDLSKTTTPCTNEIKLTTSPSKLSLETEYNIPSYLNFSSNSRAPPFFS